MRLADGLVYYDVREGKLPLDAAPLTLTLSGGVKGDGPLVEEGKSVQFLWVLRRSNGYFVDGSSNYGNEPFI